MKIFIYCQHVLGVGHFFRILEICKELKRHDIVLITGGEKVESSLPANVREVRLPALMMDDQFKDLYAIKDDQSLESICDQRVKIMWELFSSESPHIFIIELYPFGRKKFRFELDPILKGIKEGKLPPCRVVCSLRDILVEKEGWAKYERRVIKTSNEFFDAILIHSDETFIKLDETFEKTKLIKIPIVYTGYVSQKPPKNARNIIRHHLNLSEEDKLIVASAGGGKVGSRLLKAVGDASIHLQNDNALHFIIYTGPFFEDESFRYLQSLQSRRFSVKRFTRNFLSYLSAADLSISMAGYNTCMNLLAADVQALVFPFQQNREQGIRAERLAKLGLVNVLRKDQINGVDLSKAINASLGQPEHSREQIKTNGAAFSATWLENWMDYDSEIFKLRRRI